MRELYDPLVAAIALIGGVAVFVGAAALVWADRGRFKGVRDQFAEDPTRIALLTAGPFLGLALAAAGIGALLDRANSTQLASTAYAAMFGLLISSIILLIFRPKRFVPARVHDEILPSPNTGTVSAKPMSGLGYRVAFGIIGLLAAVILINGLPAWTLLALFFVLAAIGRFSQRQA